MAEPETNPTGKPVDEFLATVDGPRRPQADTDWPTIGFSPRTGAMTLDVLRELIASAWRRPA
jgi:hypothetical protein